ncbi:DnaJ domain-containing protein [Kitasatospora sp. NPDC101155]|uniref:DnaJ domain-containing protein n=1 Tax=Kitasatospora sp. NPDC101155 TaxID=3364097 RepID=UPI0038046EEF
MSTPRDDPYRVLGLPRGATRDRIASAYRALARALHPDTNPDPAAAEQLARVIDAHHRLTDAPDRHGRPVRTPAPRTPAVRPPVTYPEQPHGATVVAGPVRISPPAPMASQARPSARLPAA